MLDRRRARIALALAVAAALLVLVVLAGSALVPIALGLAIAYLLAGPVERLARLMPRWLALLLMFFATVGLIFLAFRIVLPPLVDQLATLAERTPELLAEARTHLEELGFWWTTLEMPPEVRTAIEDAIASGLAQLYGVLQGWVAGLVVGLLRAAGFVLGLVVVPFFVFYVVRDQRRILGYLTAVSGRARDDVLVLLRLVDDVLGRWVRAQLLLMVSVGVASFVGTLVLGTLASPTLAQFALVLGVFAGITELFPVVGPIIGAVPAVVIALTDDPLAALWVLLLYLAIQQLENAVLVPKIVGDALALHPAALIAALIVGGAVFGLLGAVLAAPLLAFGRSIYRYVDARLEGVAPADALARARARPGARP